MAKAKKADKKAEEKKAAANPLLAGKKIVSSVLKDDSFVEVNEGRLKKSIPHLPTGSIVADFLIGGRTNRFGVMPCPGLPRGRIINLYGMESAGKTTLALTASATTIAKGGTVCFIDWEHAIDLAYSTTIGVPVQDPKKFMLVQPDSLEKGIKVLWAMAKAGVTLIIVDSVSAGIPESVMSQQLEDKGSTGSGGGGLGNVARIWSQFLPQLQTVITRTGSCVIGISQLRDKINMSGYGDKTTAAGGNAWKFYSALRLRLKRVKSLKETSYDPRKHQKVNAASGAIIRLKIDKCKVAGSQGLEDDFYIKFGEGIDDVRSVIDTASAHGVVKKGGAWLTWERKDGTEIRGQGMQNFREELTKVDGAWPELYKATMTAMSSGKVEAIPEPEEDDFADIDAILTGNQKSAEGDSEETDEE